MVCTNYQTGTTQQPPGITIGQQPVAGSAGSGSSMTLLGFVGLLGLMYFMGRK